MFRSAQGRFFGRAFVSMNAICEYQENYFDINCYVIIKIGFSLKKRGALNSLLYNLCINTLVTGEDKCHVSSCRSIFVNLIVKFASHGRAPSSEKLTACFIMCYKLEDDSKLYTVKEFCEAIEKLVDDVNSWSITKLSPTKTINNYP